MEYADEMPETDDPLMVIYVSAKCPLCEEGKRCGSPGEAKEWAREHRHPRDLIEYHRSWVER